ncbi:MAG: cobalt-zinc-cadmium efflux system outer membrane protein [Candidatus Azotimanducaceae bacterium]|jgi:cobalt-zinc-cadmium efflux system outer membrane protein
MFGRKLRCFAALLLVSVSTLSAAEEKIDLQTAIKWTLQQHPEIAVSTAKIDAAAGAVIQSALPNKPVLTLEAEDFLGSGSAKEIDSLETTLSLSFLNNKSFRESEVGFAKANMDVSTAKLSVLRLDVAAETAGYYIEVLGNQALCKIRSDAVTLSEETYQMVSLRVDAGRSPRVELSRAKAELLMSRLMLDDCSHEVEVSRYRLFAQWQHSHATSEFLGDVYTLPSVPKYQTLKRSIENNPDLALYLTRHRLVESNLKIAEQKRKSPLRYSVGARYRGSTNDFALLAGVDIPLAWRNRNQGSIQAARADVNASQAESVVLRSELDETLFSLYQGAFHSLEVATVLRDEVLPTIKDAEKETRDAYVLGRYGYQELRTVQKELLDVRYQLLEASVGIHLQNIEIERLLGGSISGSQQ